MIRLTFCVAFLATTFLQPPTAESAESPAFYKLATQYRSCVERFESLIRSFRGIDRNDERLVDRLEDASRKLKLAARNPRHSNRLFHEWQAVQKLHREVEQRIFGKYTPNHDIDEAWYAVTYYYALFAEEFFYDVENPRHDGTIRRIESTNSRRNSYFRSNLAPPEIPTPGITLIPPR
ncbi:MAG: hypothetical protein ACR2NZ_22350 [Rubripirellula sp.]